MGYEFKLDIGNEIVEADYSDIVTFEQRMNAIKEGVKILEYRPFPKILINLVGAKMEITPDEKRALAQYISEQHALINAKTAFLIRCEQVEREDIDDVVLRVESFVSQVFFNRAHAIEWLNEA